MGNKKWWKASGEEGDWGLRAINSFLATLGENDSKGLRRATQGVAIGAAATKAVRTLYQKNLDRQWSYFVSLNEEDNIWTEAHAWVLKMVEIDDIQHLEVASKKKYETYGDEESRGKAGLKLFYAGDTLVDFEMDGHPYSVIVNEPDGAKMKDDLLSLKPRSMKFYCKTTAARERLLQEFLRLAEEKMNIPPRLFTRQYNHWYPRTDLPLRSIDSVVLRAGVMERITLDLNNFLDAEKHYNRLGIPWHRGYLFHGIPGTGKSSLAQALASHFDLDLYFSTLNDEKNDTSLIELISSVPPRSVLLLEDIDSAQSAKNRDGDFEEKGEKSSIAALLNALDSVVTPSGLITIMTTNHRDRLDPALVRPGRMDLDEELLPLDDEQASRLAEVICGVPVELPPLPHEGITASVFIEAVKPYFGTSENLVNKLVEAVKGFQEKK